MNGWIHDLAKAEIHPEAEHLLSLGKAFDPGQAVEESAVNYLTELRGCFNDYIKAFNGYSEAGSRFQEIKIYAIANTPADFMLYRNAIKLVVAHSSHGLISISFAQHVRGTLAVDGQMPTQIPGQQQELVAQVGPFRDVEWTFQSRKVTPDQVAKFYFAEFVRATREAKRSKAGNHLLLEQIKALLHEKGLEL